MPREPNTRAAVRFNTATWEGNSVALNIAHRAATPLPLGFKVTDKCCLVQVEMIHVPCWMTQGKLTLSLFFQ